MDTTKNPIKSMTIVAGLTTIIVGGLALFGVGVDQQTQETVTQIILSAATIVSGVMAIIGRIRATKQISIKKVESQVVE